MKQSSRHDERSLPLAQLELREVLGRGSQSMVYRATHGEREFAVKKLTVGHGGREAVERFYREANALARLSHPSIPVVHVVGEYEGEHLIVMELVRGETLAVALESGPLEDEHLVRLASTLASALAEVHRFGLVHQDLKPSNILLDSHGAKLVDFGFVGHIRAPDETAVGTFLYSAPEQTGMLKRPVDGRADLYALGAVLYEAATGEPPYKASDAGELMRKHAVESVPDPRDLRPGLDEALAAIIRKLLAKDPDDRYEAAETFLADLRRLPTLRKQLASGESLLLEPQRQTTLRFEVGLVGRSQQLETLSEHWQSACSGRGRFVLLKGRAGSGKSRLAEEVLAEAGRSGALILQGKCALDEGKPFSPVRQALDGLAEQAVANRATGVTRTEESLRSAAGDVGAMLARISERLGAIVASDAHIPDSGDTQEQFLSSLGTFVSQLSRVHGPVFLFLDDLQWLDPGSAQLLRRLAQVVSDCALLVIATARDEEEYEQQIDAWETSLGPVRLDQIVLRPLDDYAVLELVQAHLGGGIIDQTAVLEIAQRCAGNPFAIGEYIRALLDAGALLPSWGHWILDRKRLDDLQLPDDVIELILRRTNSLGESARLVLATGAVVGARFEPELLSNAFAWSKEQVVEALEEAYRARVLGVTEASGEVVFVHDRVREALLSLSSEKQRRQMHARLGGHLDALAERSAEHGLACAHHLVAAAEEAEPDLVFRACVRAGQLAGERYAFDEGERYFAAAAVASDRGGIDPDAHFHEAYGDCCARVGKMERARQELDRALEKSREPMQRAEIYLAKARLHMGRLDIPPTLQELKHAMDEVKVKVPSTGLGGVLVSLLYWLAQSVGRRLGIIKGPKNASERRRYGLIARLHGYRGYACYFDIKPLGMVQAVLRGWHWAMALGPSREMAEVLVYTTTILATRGRESWAMKLFARGMGVIEKLRDPVIGARVRLFGAISRHFLGHTVEAETVMTRCLESHGHWLENADFLTGCADRAWNLMMRGYTHEGWHSIEEALRRAAVTGPDNAITQGHTYRCYAGPLLVMLGRTAEGMQHLKAFETLIAEDTGSRWRWCQYLSHRTLALVLQGELGDTFERVVAQHEAYGLPPDRTPLQLRHYYVAVARARLTLYERAEAADRAARRKQLARALQNLQHAATHVTLRCHLLSIQAGLAVADDDAALAIKLLARAESLALESDNSWVLYDVALWRAELRRRKGETRAANRHMRSASMLASSHGWALLSRALREQWSDHEAQSASFSGSSYRSESVESVGVRRHLESLLQISLASASIRNPDAKARSILDELVKLLGAERGILFLAEEQGTGLRFAAGRDAEKKSLPTDSPYSSTVVNRVWAEQKPVVVSGTLEREVLQSESVRAHDLRSIVAAPMKMRERMLGVVYLDSRIARGVFTSNDVEILVAAVNHIAVALETRRAAELEAAVEVERGQRQLAETLTRASRMLNASLASEDVARTVLEMLADLVPCHRAWLLLGSGWEWTTAFVWEKTGTTRLTETRELAESAIVRSAVGAQQVRTFATESGEPAFVGLESGLAVPLTSRGGAVGILLLGSEMPGAFGPRDVEVITVFAGQAATSLENAELFEEVKKRAITDPLTGIHNRRHFEVLAIQELKRAKRRGDTVTLLMLDLDHFKAINDNYGHPAGDAVLRHVADRVRGAVRESDLFARHGGEEFIVLLVDSHSDHSEMVAERICRQVKDVPTTWGEQEIAVSVSIGLADARAEEPTDLPTLIARADAALYAAKEAGRDCVRRG